MVAGTGIVVTEYYLKIFKTREIPPQTPPPPHLKDKTLCYGNVLKKTSPGTGSIKENDEADIFKEEVAKTHSRFPETSQKPMKS